MLEYDCGNETLMRLAIIMELTKEPTDLYYIVEKLNLLFNSNIKVK